MPNHIHGIIEITDYDKSQRHAFDLRKDRKHQCLPIVIGSYKSSVSKEINNHYPGLNFKWQTSYYDRIIRDSKEFENISNYILSNPVS